MPILPRMWILYFVNISAWILGCNGYGSYYNPAPVYSAGPAYSNSFYGNSINHGNTVPSAVQDVAMQLQYQKQHSTFNNPSLNLGGFPANNILPNTNQYSTNYVSTAQNQYPQQYHQNPQPQYSYAQQQYPGPQSSPFASQNQVPQWDVVSGVSPVQTQYPNVQPQVQTEYPNVQPPVQTQYPNVQPQVQTQYPNVQPQVQTQYQNVQPQMQYQNVQPQVQAQYQQPTSQAMVQAQLQQVLQNVVQPAVGGSIQATALQVDTSNLNPNTLVQTQYDPQTRQFLSAIQPLMQPEPSNHPTLPKLYFVMPDNMLPQYPSAVVIARGEPQPGFSIVKWSPENQVTQQVQTIQQSDAKSYEYDSYDYDDQDQYQYNYDGSDYDYLATPQKNNDPYSYDDYSSNNDYDYATNYQNHNAPVQRRSHQGQGQRQSQERGVRGRYANFNGPRRRIHDRKMQYRRSRNNIPMYMRFAKAFGARKAKSIHARGPSPRPRPRSRPTLRSRFRTFQRARPIPKPGMRPRTRSKGPPRQVSREKFLDGDEEEGDFSLNDIVEDPNVEVIYEYEYGDGDESEMQFLEDKKK